MPAVPNVIPINDDDLGFGGCGCEGPIRNKTRALRTQLGLFAIAC